MSARLLPKVAMSSTVCLFCEKICSYRPLSDITVSGVIVERILTDRKCTHRGENCQGSFNILFVPTFKAALCSINNLLSFDAACPQTEFQVKQQSPTAF